MRSPTGSAERDSDGKDSTRSRALQTAGLLSTNRGPKLLLADRAQGRECGAQFLRCAHAQELLPTTRLPSQSRQFHGRSAHCKSLFANELPVDFAIANAHRSSQSTTYKLCSRNKSTARPESSMTSKRKSAKVYRIVLTARLFNVGDSTHRGAARRRLARSDENLSRSAATISFTSSSNV
jgi:hypothetical protein